MGSICRFWFLPLLLLFAVITTGCDIIYFGDGIVVDEFTKKPIDSVRVEAFLVSRHKVYFVDQVITDSTGHFSVGTGPLGADGAEMDFMIILSKPGYYNLVLNAPKDETVFLVKEPYVRSRYEKVK